MKLILDSADAVEIKRLSEILNVWGVTTNPSIIAREGKDFSEIIEQLQAVMKPEQMLFIQVMAHDHKAMVEEGRYISTLRKNIAVKIPVSAEGLKAIKQLHQEGIKVLATAIMNADQGFMAALNGADYLAPYVNRMNEHGDGIAETLALQKLLDVHQLPCEIVAASLKTKQQVRALLMGGISAVTIPPQLAESLYQDEHTDEAIRRFDEAWYQQFKRKTLI